MLRAIPISKARVRVIKELLSEAATNDIESDIDDYFVYDTDDKDALFDRVVKRGDFDRSYKIISRDSNSLVVETV